MSCRFLLVIVIGMVACSNPPAKKDFVLNEKDLIPEGVAFDNRTGTIYVGSTFKRKIIKINRDGKVSDFIPEKMENVWSLIGMEVDEKRGILWANTAHANAVLPLIDADSTKDWMTNVVSFDLETAKVIRKYDLNAPQGFLNDLTVMPNGDVYITESMNHKLYRIPSGGDSLQLFADLPGFDFLNGIVYSEEFNSLFVCSSQGILKIDTGTKAHSLLRVDSSIDAKDIDGLTIYKHSLIGHQSEKVSKFNLNDAGNEISSVEIVDSGPEFDSSTTGELDDDGNYYFIVNSQIRSGIDTIKKTIKPVDQLKNTIIRRIKL